jgi:hypothetical protein
VRRYLGFKCKLCYRSTKELFGCTLSFEEVSVQLLLCKRCLYRFGLRAKRCTSLIIDPVKGK